jgi:hydroxypyruvate isomerase
MVNYPSIDGLGGINKAFNRVEHHDKLVTGLRATSRKPPITATNADLLLRQPRRSRRRKRPGELRPWPKAAHGLRRTRHKVTLIMELLNSKRSHKDYQCDHTTWGVELVKRVGSERFKLLYDIYHMQIMDGDVCDTIKENHQYFDHYHTGGVPGRAEIDDTQELNYPRIMQAIVATGFKGYVAQEFVPKRDPLTSLKQSIGICDV